MKSKKEITNDLTINAEMIVALGFRKSCDMYLKSGMSLRRNPSAWWTASYKFEPIKDVFKIGDLIEYMEQHGVSNELGVTSK